MGQSSDRALKPKKSTVQAVPVTTHVFNPEPRRGCIHASPGCDPKYPSELGTSLANTSTHGMRSAPSPIHIPGSFHSNRERSIITPLSDSFIGSNGHRTDRAGENLALQGLKFEFIEMKVYGAVSRSFLEGEARPLRDF